MLVVAWDIRPGGITACRNRVPPSLNAARFGGDRGNGAMPTNTSGVNGSLSCWWGVVGGGSWIDHLDPARDDVAGLQSQDAGGAMRLPAAFGR
jgi:hypothetical protein